MKKILIYSITKSESGYSIHEYLKAKGFSKHLLVCLKNSPAGILLNGQNVFVNHILQAGETLEIRLEESESSPGILPVPMELNLVYEDEDLMVINKPAGLPVHPSQGHFDQTLANGVAYYFQQKGEPFIYRAINRLDKDTSGLLVLARHRLSASLLSEMVKHHQIHRQYLAVVKGQVPATGTVSVPIARVSGSVLERRVDFIEGSPACTHYQCLFYNPQIHCSLLRLTLETGRTHQIRVHMGYLGHPLLGDFLYNPDFTYIRRQSLHSHRLSFLHPFTGEYLQFEAPLPKDMTFIFDDRSVTTISP